jgi:hypothetical protein
LNNEDVEEFFVMHREHILMHQHQLATAINNQTVVTVDFFDYNFFTILITKFLIFKLLKKIKFLKFLKKDFLNF